MADNEIAPEFLEQMHRQAAEEWEYVTGQIMEACDRNEDLGDEFIERVGQELHERSRGYGYPDKPGAGPSLEISRGIARDIVEAHLRALEMHEAGELTLQ
jgi:hypothetical protein